MMRRYNENEKILKDAKRIRDTWCSRLLRYGRQTMAHDASCSENKEELRVLKSREEGMKKFFQDF